MNFTVKLPDYKSNTKEELRELCIERKIHTVRRLYSKDTCTKALKKYDRRVAGVTDPVYALDYKSWPKKDLRIFCVQRGIYLESRRLLEQSTYIKALKASDRQVKFRFLELPPELRTMVYSELFSSDLDKTVDRRGATKIVRHPQILRVSKLCHKEASDVLNQQSSLILETCKVPASVLMVTGDVKMSTVLGHHTVYCLERQLAKFAALQYASIRLSGYCNSGTSHFGLEYILPALFAIFNSENALKVLTIKFKCTCRGRVWPLASKRHVEPSAKDLAKDLAKFKTSLRASDTMRRLPAATRLQLVGFEGLDADDLADMLQRSIHGR
ncbi:hypothetical protein TI39_contig687g00004 [Zymoseptoria brevis]|uniref:Uncharacterized protein n=1 Tax=Zymoseptoria brevis TaxID=1047168 RepID=A0A0F4GFP1_9PEZI|nr:hypothetical protein TI39_contig687g00004 [Zymoseptoria brevis]